MYLQYVNLQETVNHLQLHVVDLETQLTTAREDLRNVETDRNHLLQVTPLQQWMTMPIEVDADGGLPTLSYSTIATTRSTHPITHFSYTPYHDQHTL